MKKRRFVPGPAMVVSLIALFVALGGTSYAALTLPKNSVGTKQLKNGAVTAAKISGSALEKAKIVGAVGAPAYQNAWGPPGPLAESVSFYKDPWGIVHLQGSAARDSPANNTIFTLPAGYRPKAALYLSTYGGAPSPGYVEISANGDVISFTSLSFIGLSNISFRAGH